MMNEKFIFLLTTLALLVLSHILIWLTFKPLSRLVYKPKTPGGKKSLGKLSNALKWGLFFVIFPLTEHLFSPEEWAIFSGNKVFRILFIINFSWILIELSNVLKYYFLDFYTLDKADNLKERRIYTQISFVRKIAILVIVIMALSVILMSFDVAREAGQGILASAGVAGIIIGLAAQKSIANLLAGFQIAFTQPIRIDDVVVVEGEWGKIEEINLTYVVVCIWDQRRLVLPIYYFLEKPFQNWTRTTATIWGTVFLYVDHTIPINELKEKLKQILDHTPLWDGKVQVLQVTDVKPSTIELRCLMSAKDSPTAFDLRCLVREEMVRFIQEKYPASLPKTRVLMDQAKQEKFKENGPEV
ncbi:mechanosensitive ion channel [Echinicola jeungdonensis]|uniref:Mechanosensitive ion channel family protein n=1 Tax=Echinicola jeungdonensis TaxID=709343 RepID=A0ABV5J4J0_9BACT|nr:mechanosensitive ion channel domain-containing protein [Echinicola jeungdonensis]MDN3668772.1 mechanosensitive ion channel [Echinicola jeungdonensis]